MRVSPASNLLAYSRCQRNGGCTTTTLAPSAWASSRDWSSLPQGSRPHTRWVISRFGACTASTGTPWYSDSRGSTAASWLTGSVVTMISMPS